MKDQHEKIKGYRDLSQAEIDAMNAIKLKAEEVGILIQELFEAESTDKRWVAIAKTDLQTGFMAAVRSVAKPDSF